MATHDISQDNFDSTILKYPMVLVDFWAKWCGPCRAFSEIYHSVSEKYPDIFFAKVNIETETQLAEDFNIRSIPFLMIFRGNVAVYAEAGALTEPALLDIIQRARALDISTLASDVPSEE